MNMHFNRDKFECIRFWANPNDMPQCDYLGPDGEPIEVKQSLKDLGVQISDDLSFKLQVEKIVAAASKMAGWGLRSFRRRSLYTMKTIWKTLVQPKLDYCSQYWSPGDQESINRIESVQRHFLSNIVVPGVDDLSYWARLSKFKFTSQERRRERYMVIFLWKIAQGLVHGYHVEFTSSRGRRGRLALPKNIIQSSSSLVKKARESSLGVKGARIFNLLPPSIRNIDSDNAAHFKKELDTFLSDVPDQPTVAGHGRAAESNSLLHQLPLFFVKQELTLFYFFNLQRHTVHWLTAQLKSQKHFLKLKISQ